MWGSNRKQVWITDLAALRCRPILGTQRVRVWPLVVGLSAFGMLLIGRLFQLTVVEGSWHRKLADENRILTMPIAAPRGVLLDRGDTPLTRNAPAYRRQVPGTNPAELRYEPVDRETALALLTDPAERVSYEMNREYPCGPACAPVIGYVGEIGADELVEKPDYHLGELMGKVGAEKAYERLLRGQPGTEYLEINARGKAVRSVGVKQPQSGTTLKLSVDVGLQQLLYEAFEGKVGAAVALVPQTGELLALVSAPAYDPGNMAAALSQPNQPFFNRALSGAYAPGSTFKLVTAVAALEEGAVTADTLFQDTGVLTVGNYSYGNWLYEEHGRTEGSVNVVKALSRSNDIFFYHAGGATGPDSIAEWAELLGFGKTWELSAWGEAAGLVPSPAWKKQRRGERWFLGNTYHMSIGQGDVLTTPLQVAVMTGAIAANGIICPPHFTADTKPTCQQLNLRDETVALIKEGMVGACAPGGTATPFFSFEPRVGCKTGTAQQGGEKELPHGWITVYAPAENPTIALTVLVEKGGQGSEVAAPIARKGVEYWLKK